MRYPEQERVEILKERAQSRCEGCRLSWRLDGWRHREPMPIECQAKEERQELRDIAEAARTGAKMIWQTNTGVQLRR